MIVLDSHLARGLQTTLDRYTKEEFEDLCFDFGIELDEDTEAEERAPGVPPELKIGQFPTRAYSVAKAVPDNEEQKYRPIATTCYASRAFSSCSTYSV